MGCKHYITNRSPLIIWRTELFVYEFFNIFVKIAHCDCFAFPSFALRDTIPLKASSRKSVPSHEQLNPKISLRDASSGLRNQSANRWQPARETATRSTRAYFRSV